MSHTVKLFERIINHMLRTIVELGNIHFVFRRGRSTVDPVGRFFRCCTGHLENVFHNKAMKLLP